MASKTNSVLRGDRIFRIRKAKGITQEEMAEATGYARNSSISELEAGTGNPPAERIQALADLLGVRVGWLFGEGSEDEYGEGGDPAPPSSPPPSPVQPTITPYRSVPGLDDLVGLYLAMKPAARADALRVVRALSGNRQYPDAPASAEPTQLRPRKRRGQSGPRP